MNEKDLKVLVTCGLLHDIGKLRVPNDIITKPGKLTVQEYEIVKKHPQYGYEMLKDKKLDRRVKLAALQHHERFGGTGYPYGLMGSDIEYFSSIVAVADVYDAMTASRIYRAPICPFEVVKMMYQDAFTKFDPIYAIPFLKNVVASYIGTNVKLSDGRTGNVVLINDNALDKPIVQCGNDYVNLSKNSGLSIVSLM